MNVEPLHLIIIGIVLLVALDSLPKAMKELMWSGVWISVAFYLAGKFGIVGALFGG